MTHRSKHMQWLRLGLLVAVVMVIGLLPSAPPVTHAQSGGSINYGTKVFGTLSAEMPRITYSFPGTAGDVITATADNWAGTLDLQTDLIAPNGVVIASSAQNTLDDNMQGAYLSAVLPTDGIYLLWITSAEGTAGDFALTLLGRPAPDSTELIFGEAVDVDLVPAAEPQLFWFEAQDCPTSLIATNLSEGQPFTYPFVVRVYDQRGQTVALLRGGEEQEDWVTVTPRSGRYEVEVSSDDPQATGRVRLLVSCGASAPGCAAGQAGIPGVVGTGPQECPSCFTPDNPPDEGGCPDLHFMVEQNPANALHVRVSWDEMPGATGYAVYVYGSAGGGEVYLTHAVWSPGDPTMFIWFLPHEYVSFRFVLRVYVGETVVCVQETGLEFEGPPDQTQEVCDEFTVTGAITNPETREITWTWTPYPGAEAYAVDWFEVLDDDTEVLQGSNLYGPETTSITVTPPAPTGSGDRWRIRVRVQLEGRFPCVAEDTLAFVHRIPVCAEFTVVVTANTGTEATIIWSEYPGAMGYMVSVLDETGETMLPGYPQLLPIEPRSIVLALPPGTYIVRVGPWMEATFCEQEVRVGFEPDMMCDIRALQTGVPMRFGPGLGYAVWGVVPLDTDVRVIGQAMDAGGIRWWQVDPAQYGGGVGVAGGLWVQQDLVEADRICGQVPGVQIPPPEQGPPPGQEEPEPTEPGQWLPCGSCDSCGHPANECVTSPEGACLWDPATCVNAPPGEAGPGCLSITATVDLGRCQTSASAMLDTVPNCDGGYSPGTTISAHAVAVDPKCNVEYWSGCGASGADNSVTFTANSSCTLVAHMYYGN